MTSSSGAELLRSLGSGVRPYQTGSEGSQLRGTEAPGAVDFASLLQQARSGAVSSGKPVSIGEGAAANLTEDQLKRLEQAADVAEASGATKALVLMDGMAIKLDVGVRTVTGVAPEKDAPVLTGFDTIVRVPDQGGLAPQNAAMPPARLTNASLLKVLSRERDSEN